MKIAHILGIICKIARIYVVHGHIKIHNKVAEKRLKNSGNTTAKRRLKVFDLKKTAQVKLNLEVQIVPLTLQL